MLIAKPSGKKFLNGVRVSLPTCFVSNEGRAVTVRLKIMSWIITNHINGSFRSFSVSSEYL